MSEEFKFYTYEEILDFLGIKYDFENENNKEYPYNRNIEDIEFMYGYIVIPRYGIEKIVQNKISNIKEEVLDEITMLVQIPFINEGKIRVIAVNVSLSFRYDKTYKYGDINKSIEEVCYAIIRNAKVTNDFYIIDDSYFGDFMSNFVMNNQWGIGRKLTISSYTIKYNKNFNEIEDKIK